MHPEGSPPTGGEAEEGGGAAEVTYGAVAPGGYGAAVRGGGGGGDGEGCTGEDDGAIPAAEVSNGEEGEDRIAGWDLGGGGGCG